ncbi:MAG TPA: methyltransferase domain-containing protein [Bacteroidales bacterium]|jgi:hypothetical protein|nr:methyltransferase domain-containing protein [Bacteroidales bacterium]
MTVTSFSDEQFRHIYPDGIENHYWNHARNRIILRFLKRQCLDSEPILEIGGGRGVVAKFLHDKRINITSVELAPVNPVEGTDGYFFSNTDAFELSIDKRSRYSLILLLDVLEHMENPASFISKIIRNFPNLKYLLVTVPARQELWTNYDDFNGHFRRYSILTLHRISEEIRFSTGGYFNHILYPFFLLFARLIRKREIVLKAPEGLMIPFHRFLSWILQLDYIIMPAGWRGTSCIGLFRIEKSSYEYTSK